MKRPSRIAIWVLLGVVLLAVGSFLKRQLDIDACLDKGGRWNCETSQCERDFP
jgi:hypothetical protein